MATKVLPDPTSPCSRRAIGRSSFRSARISWIDRRWAPVSGKGRPCANCLRSFPGPQWRAPGSDCWCWRRCDDVELQGEEFLEGEESAGIVERRVVAREMDFAQRSRACPIWKSGVLCSEIFLRAATVELLQAAVDEGAQRSLADAFAQAVDRGDAAEVDRGLIGVWVDDLELRVVDDEALTARLHFAVGDELLAGGDDLLRHMAC